MSGVQDGRVMISPSDALLMAGVMAIESFELGPVELAVVDRALPGAILAFVLAFVETDDAFSERWRKAEWLAKGELLREALLWVLTPEPVAVSS